MIKGFKDFLLRGNVVDLAVAFVIGAAFALVVKGLLDGLVTPLVAAVFSAPDLSRLGEFTLNGAVLRPGLFLDAVVNFVVIAAAVYFLVVVPMNRLMTLRKQGVEPEPTAPAEDVLLLTEIRDLLRAPRP